MPPNNPNNENMHSLIYLQSIPYMLQEKYNQMIGNNIAPDTIGVDYFFLTGFLTAEMELDFPVIEHEFLKNCSTKLDEFNAIGWYGGVEVSLYNPVQVLHMNIIRLIYNGAKAKDEYCLELIKSLYKTYHKKEYNKLKKFRMINADDVINLSINPESPLNEKTTIARILAMGNFMSLEIDEECFFFYYMLNDERDAFLPVINRHLDTDIIPIEKFSEYGDLLENWMKEEKEKSSCKDEAYATYYEACSFIAECFKQFGFSDDYMQVCTSSEGYRVKNLIHAYAILKKVNPKKEYTLYDAYIYSSIVQLITAFTDVITDFDYEVGFLLGEQLEESELEDALFKPYSITVKESNRDKKTAELVNVAPIQNILATKEDYLAEVNVLRGRLKAKDQDIKQLRDKNRILKQSADDTNSQIESLKANREELIALRNFVYNLKDEAIPEGDELTMMRDAICDKKIVIIGGHQKWHNKLKNLFPKWTLIYMDEFKTVTTNMLENHDFVFFYSDYLSHKSYYRCVAMLRENGIPFGYLHGVNPDITVKQVYDAIKNQ